MPTGAATMRDLWMVSERLYRDATEVFAKFYPTYQEEPTVYSQETWQRLTDNSLKCAAEIYMTLQPDYKTFGGLC